MPQRTNESLFWLRQNLEHAVVLALYRPVVQDALYTTTKAHEGRLRDVYNEALDGNKGTKTLDKLLRDARMVVSDWDAFLRQLFESVVSCGVPTGQTSPWPNR